MRSGGVDTGQNLGSFTECPQPQRRSGVADNSSPALFTQLEAGAFRQP